MNIFFFTPLSHGILFTFFFYRTHSFLLSNFDETENLKASREKNTIKYTEIRIDWMLLSRVDVAVVVVVILVCTVCPDLVQFIAERTKKQVIELDHTVPTTWIAQEINSLDEISERFKAGNGGKKLSLYECSKFFCMFIVCHTINREKIASSHGLYKDAQKAPRKLIIELKRAKHLKRKFILLPNKRLNL